MNKKKPIIALVALLITGIVGVTYAYFTVSERVNNFFGTQEYKTTLNEIFTSPTDWSPGTVTEKVITVSNTGKVPVKVRITYNEKWVAIDGTKLSNEITINDQTEKIAIFEINDSWVKQGNYYYYDKTLNEGETTEPFIEEVIFNENFSLNNGAQDIKCEKYTDEEGNTGQHCISTESGYAGATYTLEIIAETIQEDAANKEWAYTSEN